MWFGILHPPVRLVDPCRFCRLLSLSRGMLNVHLDSKYTDIEKEKILKVMNEADAETLARYKITKAKLRNFKQWKDSNGSMKTLSDIGDVESFTEKTASQLFDSILSGPTEKVQKSTNKIKGQVLQPPLTSNTIKNCNSVLSLYVTVNSVSWTLIDKAEYEVVDWKYHSISYPDAKKMQITDILNIAWNIVNIVPTADIYVMKAEPTTLRAAGSDPNNPKVLAINLQKAQMVSMIVALLHARDTMSNTEDESNSNLNHKVYFLRPTLPYRLYGTLVGNERVTTDQTVEILLQNMDPSNKSHFKMSENLKTMFRCQKELEKDMLGHCLLLSLTFMDLCIYKNEEKITKLLQKDN